jgi:8-oxo-dGTP pyrophosphatase MutT (NUDIX family)
VSAEDGPVTGTSAPVLRIAAALIVDAEGRMLLVRKRGTEIFMQPGGKLEVGESAPDCLSRELHEELGLIVEPDDMEHVGRFSAAAANEAGHLVDCDVFEVSLASGAAPIAAAEIAEAGWFSRSDLETLPLAPLTRDNFLGWAR